MKKLITMTLCFLLASAIFAGCRGSVKDDGLEMTGGDSRYAEPTTHMTIPSMPSESMMPSEHTIPSDSYSEPTDESTLSSGDAMPRSGR